MALTRANRVRLHKAEIKRRLRQRRVTIPEVIYAPSIQNMLVATLLMQPYGDGPYKAGRIMVRAQCPDTAVGNLTYDQRQRLLSILDDIPNRSSGDSTLVTRARRQLDRK